MLISAEFSAVRRTVGLFAVVACSVIGDAHFQAATALPKQVEGLLRDKTSCWETIYHGSVTTRPLLGTEVKSDLEKPDPELQGIKTDTTSQPGEIFIKVIGGRAGPYEYRRVPCPPPRASEPDSLTWFAGVLIGKEWVKDRWVPVGQTTLGVGDPVTGTGTDIKKDPVRFKFVGGVDVPIGQYFGRSWISGVEVGAGFGDIKASTQRIPGSWGAGGITTAGAALNDTINVNHRWDIDVRGRRGAYVLPGVLLYGTAGVDFLNIEGSFNCTLAGACGPVGVPVTASASTTRPGFIYGVGTDFSLASVGLGSNWRGRIEYLHADFSSFNLTMGNPATFQTVANLKVATDTVTAGLVYRFGGSSSPPRAVGLVTK